MIFFRIAMVKTAAYAAQTGYRFDASVNACRITVRIGLILGLMSWLWRRCFDALGADAFAAVRAGLTPFIIA